MRIYDISQELFGSVVYPGDPAPRREMLAEIDKGDICNVTAISMCAHNGTHIDAPAHFIKEGMTIDQIPLDRVVGRVLVTSVCGDITSEHIREMLRTFANLAPCEPVRLLVKGQATLTHPAAEILAETGVYLYGNESQTVGPEDAPMQTHLTLLGANVILLEGVRLSHVPDGMYMLCAQPLCLGGADGAPCRAILLDMA